MNYPAMPVSVDWGEVKSGGEVKSERALSNAQSCN